MQPTFRWKCSFMGAVEYEITDRTGTYRAELKHSTSDYEMSIANGDTVRRDIKASIGILRRCHGTAEEFAAWKRNPAAPQYAVPADTVAAFNAWRAAEHARHIAELERQPERYGVILANDTCRVPPIVAVGGHYIIGTGWIKAEAEAQAIAA